MGDVYFIRADFQNLVKIGYSRDVSKRLANLKSASPVPLTLMTTIENVDISLEKKVHKIFEDDRSHGEWYFITEALEELMADPEEFDLDGYAEVLDAAKLPRYLELDNKGRWVVVFGKHYGELLRDVILGDYDYIDWILWKADFPSSVQELIAEQINLV